MKDELLKLIQRAENAARELSSSWADAAKASWSRNEAIVTIHMQYVANHNRDLRDNLEALRALAQEQGDV